ncbi:hypothetical protein LTR22_027598 [Elasticomyces elasticus]|nr:hypothetical protein LTR22_027598 [Elasticomyces elasticus]
MSSPLSWYSDQSDLLYASEQEIVDYCATASPSSDDAFNVKRLTTDIDVKIGMEMAREYQNQLLMWQLVNSY